MPHAAARSIAVGSQNIPNDARSPQAPPNKKVRVEILVNPTNDDPSEAEEGDDFVSQADMHQIDSRQDPAAEDRKHPAYYSDLLYMNSYYSVHDSVGTLFAKSLDAVKPSGYLHGWICACGGGEHQWYRGGGASFFSNPEPCMGDINLELINQVQCSKQLQVVRMFLDGQVIWHRTPVRISQGYRFEYNLNPYIILQQCKTTSYFVLLNHTGSLYPYLVSLHLLELVTTTWITAWIPNNWYKSNNVHRVLMHKSTEPPLH